jgi:NDP-sugar pyrophosphorylase family protein
MKTLLICPSARPTVRLLAETLPLAQVPVFGQGLVEYWLTHLACTGVKRVHLLVHDRPECLHALVGDGARWGLTVEISHEARELTPAEALLKYEQERNPAPVQNGITMLDHFPGSPQHPLFNSYAGWFAAVRAWMPNALMPDRLGFRELCAGVWVGLHSKISPTARLTAPCWIGRNVFIGARAVIGPGAVIEDGSFIESDAELVGGYVGPDTLVGQCTALRNSLAWGGTLINWQTGSAVAVRDAFILSALRKPARAKKGGWLERMAEICSDDKEESEAFLKDLLVNKESSS